MSLFSWTVWICIVHYCFCIFCKPCERAFDFIIIDLHFNHICLAMTSFRSGAILALSWQYRPCFDRYSYFLASSSVWRMVALRDAAEQIAKSVHSLQLKLDKNPESSRAQILSKQLSGLCEKIWSEKWSFSQKTLSCHMFFRREQNQVEFVCRQH